MDTTEKYDPNVVIQAANEKFQQTKDLEGSQMIFQSALLTWVDDAREFPPNSMEYETLQQSLATLWLAYAQFLSNAHQYKSAMEAYEQAVNCPVAGSLGSLWLAYAQLAQERERMRTAQQIYLRALVHNHGGVVADDQDRDVLWQSFLEMMQQQKNNPDLTLEELQEAVQSEQSTTTTAGSEHAASTMLDDPSSSSLKRSLPMPDSTASGGVLSDPKRMRLEGSSPALGPLPTPPLPAPGSSGSGGGILGLDAAETHVVSPEAIQLETDSLLQILQQPKVPPDILAAWMIRDGQAPAQAPEPPLFQAAPPKLSDPTGQSMLGVTLAFELNKVLQSTAGATVLQVCHGLWGLTALTEQHTAEVVSQLDETLRKAHEQREANFADRLATASTEAILVAVQSSIDRERQAFQQACQQQRVAVLQDVAWDLRKLLCAQQVVLTRLQVPTFEGPTVDAQTLQLQARVCSYLHSAFYLRNRIGAEPHVAMLQSQAKRLAAMAAEQQQVSATAAANTAPPSQQPQYYPGTMGAVQPTYTPAGNPPGGYPPFYGAGGGGQLTQQPPPMYNAAGGGRLPPPPPPPPPPPRAPTGYHYYGGS